MALTARVERFTSTQTVRTSQLAHVSAVQVIGGSALDGAVLYEDTSATAANKKLQVTGGSTIDFNFPVKFSSLHLTLGTGATEVLIHFV